MSKPDEQRNRQLAKEQRERARAKRSSTLPSGKYSVKGNPPTRPQKKNDKAKPRHIFQWDKMGGDFKLIIEICAAVAIAAALADTIVLAKSVSSPFVPLITYIFAVALCLPFGLYFHTLWGRNRTRQRAVWVTYSVVALLGLLLSGVWEYGLLRPAPTETDVSGYLIPANDPTPPIPSQCNRMGQTVPPDAIALYLGTSMAWSSGEGIRVITIAGKDVLTIYRSQEGIYLDAAVVGANGLYIAKIEKNKFLRNPKTSWYQNRPDRSTLEIHDDQDRVVLYVRYLNPTAIKVRGIFYHPNGRPLIIEEDKMRTPGGMVLSRFCAGEIREGAFSFD